jgi:hypothetical protein
VTTDSGLPGFDPGRSARSFFAATREVLLRPAAFFAAISGEGSYAAPVLYALARHVLAVILAGAYDLAFAATSGTLDDISVVQARGAAGGLLWIL